MKTSKDLFMEERESEIFQSKLSPFEQLLDTFLKQADKYENGDIDALETAILMRKDYERLEIQMNMRKQWIEENKHSIEEEASKFPEGYKGYKVVLQSRSTMNFKNIPEWIKLENAKKEFEAKSKAALKMVEKGGLNVDENGEEIPLPEVNTTSFVKFDKTK